MQPAPTLTLAEKLLLAAAGLDEAGESPFSAESLVVSAWGRYPHDFGLKGYDEQYPDSNKVLWGVMGEKGLPRRGWLTKVGQKLYTLTPAGRETARLLQAGAPVPAPVKRPAPPRLTRPQDLLLQGMLASPAWAKFRQGRPNDWTFTEAVRFWDLGDRRGPDVDEHLASVRREVQAVEAALKAGAATLGNGLSASAAEAGALVELHDALANRFARHLNLLRGRGDRSAG